MQTCLRNARYVAAREGEIEAPAVLARILLDVPRIVYRKADGSGWVMLRDRRPHRCASARAPAMIQPVVDSMLNRSGHDDEV